MTHPNPARPDQKAASTLWRGLGALAALLALLIGPPLALLVAVGNPVPEQTAVGGQLTDAAIVGLLAGIVWLAWAQLAVVVTVEAVAAVRGHGLPRVLPGCGFSQHFARRLVVTASLLLAGTGPLVAATASASPAVAATAVADCRTEPVAAPTPAAETLTRASEPVTTPTAVDTAPGSVPDLAPATGDDERLGPWYVVRPPKGHHYDSLWDIAERHLGDGLRWREIYDLNRHRPQADGQRLELARLIQPGWRLLMPTDATGLPTEQATPKTKAATTPRVTNDVLAQAEAAGTVTQTDQAPAATTQPSVPQARRAPGGPTADLGGVAAGTSSIPIGPAVTVSPPTMSAGPIAAAAPSTVEVAAQDDDVAARFGNLTLGLGAVACAGLLAELARRRRRAQRFRRPGERLPRSSEAAAAAERQVRAANAELTVTDLRDALRLLAENCREQGRSLPDVHAITLNATAAVLHLGGIVDAVSPFAADTENTWRLDSDLLADANRSDLAEHGIDPYPALVSLGVTDDAVLLVNLEAAGTLTLTGSPAETTPMLHALIAELGTSLLSSTAHLVLTDCPPRLTEMLDHSRVTVLDAAQAEKWAHARGSDVATILQAAGAPDLGHARATAVADDVWAPAVLLIGASAGEAPRSGPGISIVRVAEKPGTRWALHRIEEGWVLDPLGIALTPQRLDLATAAPLIEALATAEQPATTPESEASVQSSPIPAQVTWKASAIHATDDRSAAEATNSRGVAVPVQPAPGHDQPSSSAPRVLVLGPVEVTGVADEGAPGRKRRATELVAYLALHPGATQYQLDEALWPGCRVSRNTRNPLVSRTRQWLGTNEAGEPYLSMVAEGGHYSLAPEVGCDWHEFERLAKRGLADGEQGMEDLEAALRLVRGRPFLGVNPAAYGWAEAVTQDMISAIVDTAHALAERALAAGNFRRARWAAGRGIAAEPVAEVLFGDAIRAAQASGDEQDAVRLVEMLRCAIAHLDPDDDMIGFVLGTAGR